MAGDMTIAIIIPIYNQAEYLRACLDSLVAQTDGDFTAYCVNDGSTDGSQSIIDEYAARDARFVPVRQPNRGLSAARNAGLAAMNRGLMPACSLTPTTSSMRSASSSCAAPRRSIRAA